MKTKLVNGARTPEVIAEELKKTSRLVGVYKAPNGLIYRYYYNPEISNKAYEVIYNSSEAISVRELSYNELGYLTSGILNISSNKDIKFGGF